VLLFTVSVKSLKGFLPKRSKTVLLLFLSQLPPESVFSQGQKQILRYLSQDYPGRPATELKRDPYIIFSAKKHRSWENDAVQ
jgi:hypothetical protein